MTSNRVAMFRYYFSIGTIAVSLSWTACDKKNKSNTKEVETGIKNNEVLFSLDGKDYSERELNENEKIALYEAKRRFRTQVQMIAEARALSAYYTEQAAKAGKSVEDYKAEYFQKTVPTEKQIQEVFEKNKDRIKYDYSTIKPEIIKHMQTEEQNAKLNTVMAALESKHGYKFLVEEPEFPKVEIDTKDRAFKGEENAKVHIIEFADFTCPHCLAAYRDLKRLMAEDFKSKSVKVTFLNFPLRTEFGIAHQIANATLCAAEQKLFWEFHDAAFERQPSMSEKIIQEIADELVKSKNLNKAAFSVCHSSLKYKKTVEDDRALGSRVGVASTPTFYVNGKRIDAGNGLLKLRDKVLSEL